MSRPHPARANFIYIVLAGGAVGMGTLIIVGFSFLLRPVADDYAHGANAIGGFWSSILLWWSSWSGDISSLVILALLVGLPLVWLPYGAASSIAFLLTGLVVGWVVVLALNLSRGLPRWIIALVWSAVTLAWWTFLWASELVFPGDRNLAVAEYITHWQTVNVLYVLIPALHLVAFFALLDGRLFGKRFSSLLILFLGFLLGTSGLVWGASLGAFALIIALGKWILNGVQTAAPFFYYSLGTLVGIVVAVNSPGANVRRQFLPEIEIPAAIFAAIRVAPKGIGNWFEIVFSFQSLLLVSIGMLTAWFIGGRVPKVVSKKKMLGRVFLLLPFSLLLATVNAVSEIATYEASWHLISTQLIVFLFAVLFGHHLYFRLRSLLPRSKSFELHIWVGKLTLLLIILGMVTAGTVGATSSMVDRRVDWESGDAPLLGAADRNEDWVNSAWQILENHRTNRTRK